MSSPDLRDLLYHYLTAVESSTDSFNPFTIGSLTDSHYTETLNFSEYLSTDMSLYDDEYFNQVFEENFDEVLEEPQPQEHVQQQVQQKVQPQVQQQAHQQVQEQVQEQEVQESVVLKGKKRNLASEAATSSSLPPTLRSVKRKKVSKKVQQCPTCPYTCYGKWNMEDHIKRHNENRVKEFPCNKCEKSFDRKHDRERHVAAIHDKKPPARACDQCTKKYSRKYTLNKHKISKHGQNKN